MVRFEVRRKVTVDEWIGLLVRSTLAERRPVGDRECMAGMLDHADLLVTAWSEHVLVGAARSVTDFHYCCYLSDLAVDHSYQHQGIGRELIRCTRQELGPRCTLILLAAPAAVDYYPKLGFVRHEQAWILRPEASLK